MSDEDRVAVLKQRAAGNRNAGAEERNKAERALEEAMGMVVSCLAVIVSQARF